jgi:NAD(P)H-hydrate epimerase
VEVVREIISFTNKPLVLDADGLNALAGHTDMLKKVKTPLLLTPHPGEMARLTGLTTEAVQQRRLPEALSRSVQWGVTLVLKGARTIVASPEGIVYINPTGNPGMATGGSGDVLSGIIAGLAAQGMEQDRAAAAGVFLHGAAGDSAALDKGMMALVAGDIITYLPGVIKGLEN